MTKILLGFAAGTATAMFLSKPVNDQLMKIDFIKNQATANQRAYTAAITGGLGALVAIYVAK